MLGQAGTILFLAIQVHSLRSGRHPILDKLLNISSQSCLLKANSRMSSPITCHVLNTLTGKPAANLAAVLTMCPSLMNPEEDHPNVRNTWQATTNADGRITSWTTGTAGEGVLEQLKEKELLERIPFSIRFSIGPWYEKQGVECFWPEIEVKFYMLPGSAHLHVPVLVGPWTYTSYRGS